MIARVIHRQSVAEHSYFVGVYSHLLCIAIDQQRILDRVLAYALWHDVSEATLGDTPGPVKRALGGMDEFEAAAVRTRFGDDIPDFCIKPCVMVKAIVKLANLIDEVAYLSSEERLGNRTITKLLAHSITRLTSAKSALILLVTELAPPKAEWTKARIEQLNTLITRVIDGEVAGFSRDCSAYEIEQAEDAHRERRLKDR